MRIAILFAGPISRMGGTTERVLQIANTLAGQGIDVSLSGVMDPNFETINLTNLKVIAAPVANS